MQKQFFHNLATMEGHGVGGKIFFKSLRSLAKLLPSPDIILSQRYLHSLTKRFFFFFLLQRLRSLAKLLRPLANIFAFSCKTSLDKHFLCTVACSVLYSSVCTMERFMEFYFELGIKYKEIVSA